MSGGARPSLLFISPALPDTRGNGLAMRAGMFLEALAAHYDVTLMVVPLFVQPPAYTDELVNRYSAEMLVIAPRDAPGLLGRLRERFDARPAIVRIFGRYAPDCVAAVADRRFDVVHAMRLYVAPLAVALAGSAPTGRRPHLHLDVDDLESATARSIANVHRWNLDPVGASAETQSAARFEVVERDILPSFDRVYAGSELDAHRLRPLVRGELVVAPNAVRLPAHPVTPLTTHPFTFLFLGSLGYLPNADAVRFFCRRVLPLIRAEAPDDLRVRIAGSGGGELVELEAIAGVRVVGEVDEVTPEYADADAVIVPVRGGGGTRIKVLEAFAHRRPVVSTSIGIEGIEATAGEHYLLGDSPESLAAQCVRLMQEPDLRTRLAERAYALVSSRYTPERIVQAVAP